MGVIELGLIGSGIERSMAPMLHQALGRLTDREVRYTLHDLTPTGAAGFQARLDSLARPEYRGVNVTQPFKQIAASLVDITDSTVAAIGAVNTILLRPGPPAGHNTDYTGLQTAYRRRFAETEPGVVALLGTGGIGRAAAFAMASLGVDTIRLYDPDLQSCETLREQLTSAAGIAASIHSTPERAAAGADGVLNCSPVGMHSRPGCPIDASAIAGARWVFDAVYSPAETKFLAGARRQGVACLSGAELFFWQGVRAFEIFVDTTLTADEIEAAAAIVRSEFEARVSRNS